MLKSMRLFIGILILFIRCSAPNPSANKAPSAYTPTDRALYDTILLQDSLLFTAFNNKNMPGFVTFFDKDLEVYQDNKGLRNYEQSLEAFKSIFDSGSNLKRYLLKESMEVYPIKDYGAIQTGKHRFCHTENGKEECAIFKFLQVWHKDSTGWKIRRMITYDH